MPAVDSTAIESVAYDVPTRRLVVTFTGGKTYKYYDVPRAIYERFLQASSKGAFFNAHVRDRYDFALAAAA
jgi:hypothetical protein